MLAFGAGTLPMLLVAGAASRWLGELVRSPRLRRSVGVAVLLFGVFALIAPSGHHRQTPLTGYTEAALLPGPARLQHESHFSDNMMSATGYLHASKEDH